jgi:hypothetical protein
VGNWLQNLLIADATTQYQNRVHPHSTKPLPNAVRRRQWSEWCYIGPDDPWEGNASVTQSKHNDSAYYSHCNETHVTDKTHSNAVRLKFLMIQTEDLS